MTALHSQEITPLLIGMLIPSARNPRKSVDHVRLSELAASIKRTGVNVPLIVRPLSKDWIKANPGDQEVVQAGDSDLYEIVAGYRRRLAAEIAGLAEVPCIVRELSDEQAAEVAIIDNLQREDVPALEEAQAYGVLLETSRSIEAVAAQVGKPIEYVARRLKLRELIQHSKDALALGLITIDHAMLLAKLGSEEEEKALRYTIDRNATQKQKTDVLIAEASKRKREGRTTFYMGGYWEPVSVAKLKSFIEHDLELQLKRVPWDLADADLLPSAGSCNYCPKNTAFNNALFGDLVIKDATCTDAICFNLKRQAFVQIHVDAAERAGGAVRVSWKSTTVKPKWSKSKPNTKYGDTPADRAYVDVGPDTSRVLKYGQWIDVGPKSTKCGNEVTGVSVDFDDQGWGDADKKKKPGKVFKVCIVAGCKVHPKAWEKAEKQAKSGRVDYEAQRKAEEAKRKAYVERERPIREAIYDATIKAGKVTHEALFLGLLLRAVDDRRSNEEIAKRRKLKVPHPAAASRAIADSILAGNTDELDAWAFDVLILPSTVPHEWEFGAVKRDREELWKLAKRFGVDPDKIAAQFEKASRPTAAASVVGGTNSEKKGGRGDSLEPEPGGATKPRRAAKTVAPSSPKTTKKATPKTSKTKTPKAAKKSAAKGNAK